MNFSLTFPPAPLLDSRLHDCGCSSEFSKEITNVFKKACQIIQADTQRRYTRACTIPRQPLSIQAIRRRLLRDFLRDVSHLADFLISEVRKLEDIPGVLNLECQETLVAMFKKQPSPSHEERNLLASYLGLSEKQVVNWFSNRRRRNENGKTRSSKNQPLIQDSLKSRVRRVQSSTLSTHDHSTPPSLSHNAFLQQVQNSVSSVVYVDGVLTLSEDQKPSYKI